MAAVVSETLRVRPVVPVVVRVLQEDMQVGRHLLAKGTRVVPSIYLTNRSARVYDDPEEFRPERFLKNGPETFSWIPFGGGIRRCIGASFATLEMKLILRTMLSELEPSMPAKGRLGMTLFAGAAARGRGGARSRWCRRRARGWRGREGGLKEDGAALRRPACVRCESRRAAGDPVGRGRSGE